MIWKVWRTWQAWQTQRFELIWICNGDVCVMCWLHTSNQLCISKPADSQLIENTPHDFHSSQPWWFSKIGVLPNQSALDHSSIKVHCDLGIPSLGNLHSWVPVPNPWDMSTQKWPNSVSFHQFNSLNGDWWVKPPTHFQPMCWVDGWYIYIIYKYVYIYICL